jgi:phosphoglycolate phosphatase
VNNKMVNNGILILFDIDGTLVLGARCHYKAFFEAIKKFYGMEDDISGINYAGKTDPQILREVLRLGGLNEEEIEENFQVCLDFMAHYYLKNVNHENVRSLEGVNDLLKELQRRKVLLGLVTGNLESIAYAKLGKVGLDGYFPFGGFGSDHSNRSFLVKKALKQAQNQYGYNGKHTFVIGDTPRDIKAAKASNLLTIGVATGRYSKEELENCGADYVLNNLKNKDKILEILYK